MTRYYILSDSLPRTDFSYDQEGHYFRRQPKGFNILTKKKQSTDRNDLRGKLCPSCGITRSMTNKCECNEE
jgi:hypothetical protein